MDNQDKIIDFQDALFMKKKPNWADPEEYRIANTIMERTLNYRAEGTGINSINDAKDRTLEEIFGGDVGLLKAATAKLIEELDMDRNKFAFPTGFFSSFESNWTFRDYVQYMFELKCY